MINLQITIIIVDSETYLYIWKSNPPQLDTVLVFCICFKVQISILSQKHLYMTCRRVWLTSVTLAVCLAGLSSSYVSTAHIQQQTGFCFAHHDSRPARLHNQAVSYMGIPVPAVCMAAITLLIVYEIRKHQKNR